MANGLSDFSEYGFNKQTNTTMKTIQQIENQISKLVASSLNEKDEKILKRDRKEVKYLRYILSYLKTEPTEQIVNHQLENVERSISILNGRFETWKASNPEIVKKIKTEAKILQHYNTTFEIPKLKQQRKDLLFILT